MEPSGLWIIKDCNFFPLLQLGSGDFPRWKHWILCTVEWLVVGRERTLPAIFGRRPLPKLWTSAGHFLVCCHPLQSVFAQPVCEKLPFGLPSASNHHLATSGFTPGRPATFGWTLLCYTGGPLHLGQARPDNLDDLGHLSKPKGMVKTVINGSKWRRVSWNQLCRIHAMRMDDIIRWNLWIYHKQDQ